ncbi:hypothetical protein IKQ19_10220 [Candidatus Saccharibacteria bacterium]|nr:hypothetical protein [Candidatus Saccharibacteria bacterium]
MINKQLDEKFKLADNCLPPLYEGDYNVKFDHTMTVAESKKSTDEKFHIEKKFCIAVNTERLEDSDVFHVSPPPNDQGDFSTELPFMVFNDPTYPWIKNLSTCDNLPLPWIALIVISENEVLEEKDIQHSELTKEAQRTDVYFRYDYNKNSPSKEDDLVHLVTISKKTFDSIMPDIEDRAWLTHCKNEVDLSTTDDITTQKDGNFSVVIANRFPPRNSETTVKYTVHLIPAYLYDNRNEIPEDANAKIELISLYHWNFYSEKSASDPNDKISDKSFVSFINRLKDNSRQVQDRTLKEHFLRTRERTYSFYHGPIMPLKYIRAENINGEGIFTSDGRLIYDKTNGIFDISYAAAFNLGRLVTLSHNAEAQKIVNWRKSNKKEKHFMLLKQEIGIDHNELKIVLEKLKEGQLK